MKNVLKTLATQKEEVQKEFDELKKAQDPLQGQLNQITTRIIQLQGQWQKLEQLEKDFQDEPKE